jgi:hypothetical protein
MGYGLAAFTDLRRAEESRISLRCIQATLAPPIYAGGCSARPESAAHEIRAKGFSGRRVQEPQGLRRSPQHGA